MKPYAPPGFPALMPYLSVSDARGLQAFLVAVFDAEIADVHTDAEGRVMHGVARLEGAALEFSQNAPPWPATPAGLHVYVADVDATFRKALDQGAIALSEPTQMPYGERGATVRDPFGNHWHLATYTG